VDALERGPVPRLQIAGAGHLPPVVKVGVAVADVEVGGLQGGHGVRAGDLHRLDVAGKAGQVSGVGEPDVLDVEVAGEHPLVDRPRVVGVAAVERVVDDLARPCVGGHDRLFCT
jgi:hypothetical protein